MGRSDEARTDRAAATQLRSGAELAVLRAPMQPAGALTGSSKANSKKSSGPLLAILGACVLLVIGIGTGTGAVIVLAVIALLAGVATHRIFAASPIPPDRLP
jgi:multisubunit Na+/H+ antiporter MnhG subunit